MLFAIVGWRQTHERLLNDLVDTLGSEDGSRHGWGCDGDWWRAWTALVEGCDGYGEDLGFQFAVFLGFWVGGYETGQRDDHRQ